MNGSLARTPLTELVRHICQRCDSVVLRLENESTGARSRLFFKDGDVVFASSEDVSDRLGERLVREGALSRGQLDLACRVQAASRMRLGATLVEMGCIDAKTLDEQVREQVAAIVLASFAWRRGSFESLPAIREPLDDDLARRDLSTMDLLLDGIREHADASTVQVGLAALETTALRMARWASKAFEAGLQLTPAEGFVLSRVDSGSTAAQIARVSPLGEDETYRCLYSLITMGIVSLDRQAGPEAVESEEMASARAPMRVPLREPVAVTAHVSVSVPQPEPESESVSVRPIARQAEPARRAAPDLAAFREDMVAKHERLSSLTHYEVLDVAPTASAAEIKQAYFRLAKKLHPDYRAGLARADADLAFTDLYLAVTTAYEVLGSETARRAYDVSLRKTAPELATSESAAPAYEPEYQARVHFNNGAKFFEAEQYHEAIEELRNAVRLDDARPDYHRMLGRALSKNPKWRKLAEEELIRALTLDRFDAATYVELGELYRDSGLRTRARKMFEEAVGIDPDNARARLGLEISSR